MIPEKLRETVAVMVLCGGLAGYAVAVTLGPIMGLGLYRLAAVGLGGTLIACVWLGNILAKESGL